MNDADKETCLRTIVGLESRVRDRDRRIVELERKLAAAELACREVITDVEELRKSDKGLVQIGHYGTIEKAVDETFHRVLVCLEPLRAVLAGEGEALSDEDKADLEAAREALKEPGRVPWDDVKKRLGLDDAARAPGREGE